jgi:hypothetical protein
MSLPLFVSEGSAPAVWHGPPPEYRAARRIDEFRPARLGASGKAPLHEDRRQVSAAEFAVKMADFSAAAVTRRWRAGESDIGTSLAHPRWLAPPPRISGIVVHEVRGGLAAPPR